MDDLLGLTQADLTHGARDLDRLDRRKPIRSQALENRIPLLDECAHLANCTSGALRRPE